MSAVVVVGTQWGDEAKGKVVDVLSQRADMVVRFNGGPNAGHTVVFGGQVYALRLIPSGVFNPATLCVIADGVVVDASELAEEIQQLRQRGLSVENLRVSPNAHLILPYHRLLDRLEEEHRGIASLGTTGRGIGPAYQDKVARCGIRVGDLLEGASLEEKLHQIVEAKNRLITRLYEAQPLDGRQILEELKRASLVLRPYIADTGRLVREAVTSGKRVVFEGAQGTLLDLDYGSYPYVTSSHPIAGGACLGTGIGPRHISHILGVMKAYCTRVGAGPMPTELTDEIGECLRQKGREFGTVTGRPRRCGWLDLVAVRYSAGVNSLDGLAVMSLDVLSGFKTLKVCTAYRLPEGVTSEFPADHARLQEVQPIYEELPGWEEEIGSVRSFKDLPLNAQKYLRRIEELVGVPVEMVSVGRDREQTFFNTPSQDLDWFSAAA